MRRRLRLALAIAIALAGFGVFTEALRLMNRPSTESLLLGLGVVLALVVLVPSLVVWAWGKKEEHVR